MTTPSPIPTAGTHVPTKLDETIALRWFIVAAILIGGFFLASTPARNSDLWLWLATGRATLDGTAHFGVDPFAYTTEGVRWVNSSWLASVFLYLTYVKLGDAALVALKAAFFAASFALAFWGAMGKGRWLVAAGLTGLAMIASATSVPLRPAILAYPLLALTACVVLRPTSHNRTLWQSHWVLLPLFAFWANLNEWFLLGPVLLGLFALGQLLTKGRKALPWLGLAVAGFGICMLNPFTFRVFQLPPELALLGVPSTLREESIIRLNNAGVFSNAFLFPVRTTINPAVVAFALLALLSLATIVRPARIDRFTRLSLWALFFGLAVIHARAVPFFAIVATILGGVAFQPFPDQPQTSTKPRNPRWYEGVGLVLAGVAFVLSSWTGWLQSPPYGSRTWSVEPDPGLRKAAEQIARWRADGKIPASDRVFPLSPEAAHHLVWFCPGERVFLDQRWELYGGVAEEYRVVRNRLTSPPTPQDNTGWEMVLRKHHIGIILAHDPDRVKADLAVGSLASARNSWAMLGVNGRSVLFGWKEAGKPYAGMTVNLDRLAFSPELVTPAPGDSPPRIRPRHWLDALDRPILSPQLQRDEADEYVSLFDGIRDGNRHRPTAHHIGTFHVAAYVGLAASASSAMAPPLWSTLPVYPLAQMSSQEKSSIAYTSLLQNVVAPDAADGPIAPLLIAIRAGRRAVSEQPDNSSAYLAMGEAYLRLAQATKERHWIRMLPEFAEIRRDQAITALSEAVRLNPNSLPAHLSLATVFRQAGAQDLSLREIKEILRITKADLIKDEGKDERIKILQDERDRLETMVDQLRQRIPKEQSASVLVRAEGAFRMGLYGDALDILLKADYAEFGDDGLKLQVEALLFTGRAADVMDWIKPTHSEAIGAIPYHWARARAAACVGAYAEFDIHMREFRELLINIPAGNGILIPLQNPLAQGVGHVVLNGAIIPKNPGQFQLGTIGQREAMDQISRLSNRLRDAATGDVLRGLLAIEQGDITRTERLCRDALRLWTGPQQVERGEGLDFTGRSIAEQLLQILQAAR